MKSTDERIDAVLGRAKAYEAMQRRRRQRAVALGGGVLSVVIVVVVGVGISTVMGDSPGASPMAGQLGLMGNVFSESSALGYIVVGLLGIALGAAVTMAACRLGRREHAGQMMGAQKAISVPTLPEAAISSAKPQEKIGASESSNADSTQDDEGRVT